MVLISNPISKPSIKIIMVEKKMNKSTDRVSHKDDLIHEPRPIYK